MLRLAVVEPLAQQAQRELQELQGLQELQKLKQPLVPPGVVLALAIMMRLVAQRVSVQVHMQRAVHPVVPLLVGDYTQWVGASYC